MLQGALPKRACNEGAGEGVVESGAAEGLKIETEADAGA
jgi:hypothetical protein